MKRILFKPVYVVRIAVPRCDLHHMIQKTVKLVFGICNIKIGASYA